MLNLSICMIVKDESSNLSKLLPWLSTCGAEVLVVDTGSTDDSQNLIQKHLGTQHYFEWCDDFAKARNFSLSLATKKYILWLDADDEIDDFTWARIQQLVNKDENSAYRFVIKSPIEINSNGSAVSEESFRQLRLFPRIVSSSLGGHCAPQFQGKIHEEIRSDLEKHGVKIQDAHLEIHHMGYVNSELRAQKSKRNLEILQVAVSTEDFDPFLEMEFANALFQVGRYEEALESYAKIWSHPKSEKTEVKDFTPVFIANTFKELGQREDALDWYCKSSEEYPQVFSAHYEAARYYFEDGNWSEAEKFCLRAIEQEIQITSIPQNSLGILRNTFGLLCLGYFATKNFQKLWTLTLEFYNNRVSTNARDLTLREIPIDPWVFIECGIALGHKKLTQEILHYLCLKSLNSSHDQVLAQLRNLSDSKSQEQDQEEPMSSSKNSPRSNSSKATSNASKPRELSPEEVDKLLGTIKKPLKPRGLPKTLSVCMIVKNEESNIEAAIRSFLPFADEIIVNDTGSTDRTVEILRTLPVKVIETKWRDDFSYSRNESLKEATCSWILWMDADDRVPEDQVINFKKLKTAPLDRCFGFQIVNTQGGLPIGTRFMQTRMFPNHPDLKFERKIHEQIIFSCARLGLHSIFTETLIWHTGYEDPKVKALKAQRNLDLLADEAKDTKDPILLMQVGDSLAILEHWTEAADAYIRSYEIPNCEKINPDVWKELPNSIGRCLQQAGKLEEALVWFAKGQLNGPEKVEPWFFQGETYHKMGKFSEALPFFEQAVSLERSFSGVSNQYDVLQIYSLKYLCEIELHTKNWNKALKWSEQFLDKYPQVVESRVFRAKAYMGLSEFDKAEDFFTQAIEMNATASLEAWQGLLSCLDMQGKDAEFLSTKEKMKIHFPQQAGFVQLGTSQSPSAAASSSQLDLSVCLIVKNEESNIAECIQSVLPLGAEIIVVDTGSTDNTVAIAKDLGAKTFFFEWIQDFGAARNVSLEHASGRWILWVDADDRLPSEEVSRILSLVRSEAKTAYGFLVKNSQDGGTTGSVFNQIRLFPNHPQVRFEGKVHEQILPSLTRVNIPVEFLNLKVIHTGYLSEEISVEKQKRNLKILMDELEENPAVKTPVRYFSIGGAYFDFKDYHNAMEWYRKAIELCEQTGQDPHIREHSPVKIAECQANLGKYELALELVVQILEKNPIAAEALLLKAQMQEQLSKLEDAAQSFVKLFVFQETQTLLPVDFQKLQLLSVKFLSEYFKNSGKMELGLEILKLGMMIGKGEKISSQKVLSVLYDFEEFPLCLALLRQESYVNQDADHYLNYAKILILENHAQVAVKVLKEAVQKFPQDQDLVQLYQALRADLKI